MKSFEREIHSKEVAKKQGGNPRQDESSFVIPNGKTLRVRRFSGGHETSTKEVRTELRWDGTVVACGYGSCFDYELDMDFLGDGSKELVIRHYNGESQPLHMSAWWVGETYTNG